MLAAGYSVGKDDQALLSYSSDGPAITIDPVSTGGPGWTEFLDAYNEFCIDRKGKPMLTQTPTLDGKQVTRAFGERLAQFETARRAHDPEGRLLNPYFAALLGAEKPRASRRSRQTQTDAVR
jgi:hypothetical protein